jgi:hypothetical protein
MFLNLKCEQQRKPDEQDMLDTHDEQKKRELPQSELARTIGLLINFRRRKFGIPEIASVYKDR